MSLGDHLDELRKRLILAIAAPLPLFIILFMFLSDWLVGTLLRPVVSVMVSHEVPPELIVLSPPELLVTKLKLSVIGAIVLSAPWILYQGWSFVVPGLYAHERRFVRFLIPGSAILTASGVALLYFVMLPLMLHVLVLFAASIEIPTPSPEEPPGLAAVLEEGGDVPLVTAPPTDPVHGDRWVLVPDMTFHVALEDPDDAGAIVAHHVRPAGSGRIAQPFRVSYVVNFILLLLLGIVIAFQMPLVIVLLGWLDIVRPDMLASNRKYALIVCAVIASVITPADAVSMVAMLVPLYGLYELGIGLLRIAPAGRVAEGSILRRATPHKSKSGPKHAPEVAQPDTLVKRESDGPEKSPPAVDDATDEDS